MLGYNDKAVLNNVGLFYLKKWAKSENSEFSKNTNLSFNFFGLKAQRNALGFRSNRVDQIDPNDKRDLNKGDFNNWGLETRILKEYKFLNKKNISVIGLKYYKSKILSKQGPGSEASDDDFEFYFNKFPNYENQSEYKYPNMNLAFFGENIFYLSSNFSITPGIRFENILTKSNGYYKKINLDGAGNVILNETNYENRNNRRSFILLGIGISHKKNNNIEFYGNISQNYRSVTFADMSIINPAFTINPEIHDEKGATIDWGIRGNYNNLFSYDFTLFNILYKSRIGFIQKIYNDGSVKSERGNIGDASIYGLESILDLDLNELILKNDKMSLNYYINTSLINSKYTKSELKAIVGKEIEFVPKINIKSGINFGIKNFILNLQYTYLSKQFTDASNALIGNLSGVIGQIPSHNILDFSLAYTYKKVKIEHGINNVTNTLYFSRRATGYPGPGIIPSAPRNFYFTLQVKI